MAPSRRSLAGIGILIVIATVAAYWELPRNGFITYDDPHYITSNERVSAGLSWRGVSWAFTAMHSSNWHPLTWMSHMLDCQLFGLDARWHHVSNLALHIGNALLLLVLLRSLTGAVWRSAFVALIFAVHPMHVESVAWASERKDVLSAFFGLLSLLAYVRFARTKERDTSRLGWYGLALGLFALGLMSKPMLVTWPFVMLLLDYWPLGRFEPSSTDSDNPGSGSRLAAAKRLLLEKTPFFLLVGLSCVLTVMAQSKGGSVVSTVDISPWQRLANATIAYAW